MYERYRLERHGMGKIGPERRREAIAETEDWNCYRHYLVIVFLR